MRGALLTLTPMRARLSSGAAALAIGCALAIWTVAVLSTAAQQPHVDDRPLWMWPREDREAGQVARFRRAFELTEIPAEARLSVLADFSNLRVWLNGRLVAEAQAYEPKVRQSVRSHLREGRNVLAVRGKAVDGPAAVAVRLKLEDQEARRSIVSDASWRAAMATEQQPHEDWRNPEFVDASWQRPATFGALAARPWNLGPEDTAVTPFDDYEQWKQALGSEQSADPSAFQIVENFEIELLRSAQDDEGSWISMTFDPDGRLLIGREDRGVLRMELDPAEGITDVEHLATDLREVRGLVFHGEDLYVHANLSDGLFRLRDTDGDRRFDEAEKLRHLPGGAGHGRNGLTAGPDGRLYAIYGDAVELPADVKDLTSPLRHRPRELRGPEGFVLRFDPEASEAEAWELIAAGMRNPYDLAFDAEGELFTYDADAEYDMGAPWYRPTRLRHLVAGADYGWRDQTRRWPPYDLEHPDNPPSNLDLGKGSPTGLAFGTDSDFPPAYREALFLLDWAYGRILAVHTEPRGASYAAGGEVLVQGRPFNVTDLAFGPDGAMYVVTGGRRTRSGLYRIRYTGPPVDPPRPTTQQKARRHHAAEARALRRRLEALRTAEECSAAIDAAWPHLDSPDPWLRNAARLVLEAQPLTDWDERALAERSPRAALTAMMALARSAEQPLAQRVLDRLNTMSLDELATPEQRIALWTYRLCLEALGELTPERRRQTRAHLQPLYPQGAFVVDRRLGRLLIDLHAPQAVPLTLDLLDRTPDHEQKQVTHWLFILRDAEAGWTPERRERYFHHLRRMDGFTGGAGMEEFVRQIRTEALDALDPPQREQLEPLLVREETAAVPEAAEPRQIVQAWEMADLVDALDELDEPRDLERGRQMFVAARCVQCHQVGSFGRAVGPDLTHVASRFSRRDLLRAILRPSQVVPEQYRSLMVTTDDGRTITGRLLQDGDYREPVLRIAPNPFRPDDAVQIPKQRIRSYRTLSTSPMPEGLLNTLTEQEILDLLAYLEAGGTR